MSEVTEDALKGSSSGIPNLDTFRMSGNEGVEYWIIQHREASLVISKMVVSWLIIIVEAKLSATSYDSLRRSCN